MNIELYLQCLEEFSKEALMDWYNGLSSLEAAGLKAATLIAGATIVYFVKFKDEINKCPYKQLNIRKRIIAMDKANEAAKKSWFT